MPSSPPPAIAGQPSILLAEWQLPAEGAASLGVSSPRSFHIYGAKVPIASPNSDAWRSEYAVHEHRADGTTEQHHLAQRKQHDSVMWISADATNTDEMADMVQPATIPCLTARPRWKRDDAAIPMRADGGLYVFLKQFHVPASAAVRSVFHGGFSLFLFATHQTDDALELALFEQDMSDQTAEDHYRLEEQIAAFLSAPRDPANVEALIRAGDRYFYDFVLDSPKTTRPILEILLTHARTGSLRSAVQKRLAKMPSAPSLQP